MKIMITMHKYKDKTLKTEKKRCISLNFFLVHCVFRSCLECCLYNIKC